MHARV